MRFSVAVPRAVPRSKKSLAATMLRKYRRLRRPEGIRREYKKLRSLLPGATRSHHLRKKVGVVEAAYEYICELQSALLDKFSTNGIPEDLAGVVKGKVATASDIQALALHLINNNNNNNIASNSNNSNQIPLPLSIDLTAVVTQSLQEPNTESQKNLTLQLSTSCPSTSHEVTTFHSKEASLCNDRTSLPRALPSEVCHSCESCGQNLASTSPAVTQGAAHPHVPETTALSDENSTCSLGVSVSDSNSSQNLTTTNSSPSSSTSPHQIPPSPTEYFSAVTIE